MQINAHSISLKNLQYLTFYYLSKVVFCREKTNKLSRILQKKGEGRGKNPPGSQVLTNMFVPVLSATPSAGKPRNAPNLSSYLYSGITAWSTVLYAAYASSYFLTVSGFGIATFSASILMCVAHKAAISASLPAFADSRHHSA